MYGMVHMCFVDEAGDAAAYGPAMPDAPPAFVLVGMTVPQPSAKDLTWGFLQLKKEFEPALRHVALSDLVRHELKGATLRKDIRTQNRNGRRRSLGILDKTLRLLEDNNCVLSGKIVIKEPELAVQDRAVYAKAVQYLATTLEAGLQAANEPGLLILDSRTKVKNEGNVHSITTQRFRTGGDAYPHLLEAPVFGHSDTHVPLQIVDIVASALVFPIACSVYCPTLTWSRHLAGAEHYDALRKTFGPRLQALEYRYIGPDGRRVGGFHVEDRLAQQPTHHFFQGSQG